jgi:hypothetical protein
MLSAIERQVTTAIGRALAARAHIGVFAAPGPADALAPGKGRVLVSLDTMTADALFPRDEVAVLQKNPPVTRRILPLHFTLAVRLRVRPNGDVDAARALLLDDVAQTIFALGDAKPRDGSEFVPQQDSGFNVLTFALAEGKVLPELVDGEVAADLRYSGTAEIWPVGSEGSADAVQGVDMHVVAQKIEITATPARVVAGAASRIVVHSVDRKRITKKDGTSAPLRVAVRVVSDLPPAKRGTITSGVDGKETGMRLVEVDAETRQAVVAYVAPKSPLGGVGLEVVAVHYARSDGTAGALLGSVAIALVEVHG